MGRAIYICTLNRPPMMERIIIAKTERTMLRVKRFVSGGFILRGL